MRGIIKDWPTLTVSMSATSCQPASPELCSIKVCQQTGPSCSASLLKTSPMQNRPSWTKTFQDFWILYIDLIGFLSVSESHDDDHSFLDHCKPFVPNLFFTLNYVVSCSYWIFYLFIFLTWKSCGHLMLLAFNRFLHLVFVRFVHASILCSLINKSLTIVVSSEAFVWPKKIITSDLNIANYVFLPYPATIIDYLAVTHFR